ncbi:Os09g0525650 [Oryza sativa Japonica Group]|uniref:Os09g0525650 protein n=1 Tax=Oryza sativa subsp. japonica TaxID=39947 RepID=A0A0P0XPK2_ORYSJ|nr:hypothetical protein EE612_049045 [Oryza sativa]BAT09043.1 Os09g0525650 [Oryza sativa Japonica Group]
MSKKSKRNCKRKAYFRKRRPCRLPSGMRTTSVTAPSSSAAGSDGNDACLDARLDSSSCLPLPPVVFYAFPLPLASVFQGQLLLQQFLPGDEARPPVGPSTLFLDQLGVMQDQTCCSRNNRCSVNAGDGACSTWG